jgi:hypothetical protein
MATYGRKLAKCHFSRGFHAYYLVQVAVFKVFNEIFSREICRGRALSANAGVSSSDRGIFTWQWALGSLPGASGDSAPQPVVFRAALCPQRPPPVPAPPPAHYPPRKDLLAGIRKPLLRIRKRPANAGLRGSGSSFAQAAFVTCPAHHPFAFTDLPGTN